MEIPQLVHMAADCIAEAGDILERCARACAFLRQAFLLHDAFSLSPAAFATNMFMDYRPSE